VKTKDALERGMPKSKGIRLSVIATRYREASLVKLQILTRCDKRLEVFAHLLKA
jgi:hypothetical protein